jgi:hypothetical protein
MADGDWEGELSTDERHYVCYWCYRGIKGIIYLIHEKFKDIDEVHNFMHAEKKK